MRPHSRLNGIPRVLIHGRYDVCGPLETAWRLSQAWITSRLIVLDNMGHGGRSFMTVVIRALDELAIT